MLFSLYSKLACLSQHALECPRRVQSFAIQSEPEVPVVYIVEF